MSGHSLILFMILQPLARIESVQCTTDYRSTKASVIYQFASVHPLYPSEAISLLQTALSGV